MFQKINWVRVIGGLTPLVIVIVLGLSVFGAAEHAMATQTISPFRCAGAAMTFPVQDGGYVGWIYRDPASVGTDPSGIHSGVDFWPGANAPVAAMGTGYVSRNPIWFSSSQTYGVDIYYPSIGLESYTGHLGSIQVSNGTQVSAGTVIGYTAANDAHVHVSFGTSGYNDQSTDFSVSTPHRDPTPFWTPQGNLDFSRGATEHWNQTYNQWCGSTSGAYSVSLSASGTNVSAGTNVTLTANANVDVGPTPYYITILQNGSVVRACPSGTSCSYTTSASGATWTFVARISNSDGSNSQAQSSSINVTWGSGGGTSYSVSLSASGTNVSAGTNVTLTANANVDVGPTPYYITILQNGSVVRACGSGTSCSYTTSASGTTLTFVARISNGDGSSSQAQSSSINVIWGSGGGTSYSVSLSASGTNVSAGSNVTLTANANVDVGPTPYYITILQNGSVVRACGSGTSCSYTTSASGTTLTFVARISNGDGSSSQAQSSSINVTWGSGAGTSCSSTQYTAQYYNNQYLSGTPTFTQCEGWPINHDWGSGGPGNGVGSDQFSARWTGSAYIAGGTYTFIARADDGVRVWIDNNLIIDAWHDQAATEYRASRTVNSGNHDIKVEYYENGGLAVAQVRWEQAMSSSRTTVTVDDQSAGFVRGGTSAYWYQASIGYNSHMWWTYNRQSGVDDWGKWTPNLNGAGNYEVYVYIPANYATTGNAGYRIHHNGVDDVRRPINQNAYYNQWVSLGTYYFNDASDQYVFMGDETFETSSSKMIGFDAMQFVPR